MCASLVILLGAVVEVDDKRMSRDSLYDQFVCRIWVADVLLWGLMVSSTYSIAIIAVERYFAVIYPIWYKVRLKTLFSSRNAVSTSNVTAYYIIRSTPLSPILPVSEILRRASPPLFHPNFRGVILGPD